MATDTETQIEEVLSIPNRGPLLHIIQNREDLLPVSGILKNPKPTYSSSDKTLSFRVHWNPKDSAHKILIQNAMAEDGALLHFRLNVGVGNRSASIRISAIATKIEIREHGDVSSPATADVVIKVIKVDPTPSLWESFIGCSLN